MPSESIDKAALVELIKASFGGDRSAAGRYAAEQRWKGHAKTNESREYRELDQEGYITLFNEAQRQVGVAKKLLTESDMRAYQLWPGATFDAINQELRFGESDSPFWPDGVGTAEDAALALTKHFDHFATEVPTDVKVFRGVAYANELDHFEEGQIFTDNGLVSTSVDSEFARSFGDGSDIDAFMEILIPKGTKVWCPSKYENEKELTLRPNTQFKVKSVWEDEDDYGKVLKVQLEVVSG